MGKFMTEKLIVTPLSRITVADGDVLHALKSKDSTFSGFGEAYFSWIKPGKIKAWKMHSKMTMNLIVPVGNVRFVFTQNDANLKPKFEVIEIGEKNYSRITIPPNIWFGFQNQTLSSSLVLNLSNIEHDPSEVSAISIDAFQFDWK